MSEEDKCTMTADEIRLEIAHGSRILSEMGVLDAFGHVSCRHPDRPDHYLMPIRMAPGLVTPDDVVEHDLDGNGIDVATSTLFLERFIHGEIYRARPDVTAVVHSHSQSVLPFTVVPEARLRPLSHVCGFLDGVGPAFDVADHDGHGTDLLIRSPKLGVALAEHMGDSNVVLMRSHGFTSIGDSVKQAVFRAVYTGVNSDLQLKAMQIGQPRFLTSEEAKACDDTTNAQLARVWALWVQRHGYEPD
jgi:ribulose-5-phosphate 4-epimerase/fuculose-1-phosphate aldolase